MNFLLDFIYPKTCGICEKVSNTYLCNKCNLKIKKIAKLRTIDYTADNKKYYDYHTYIFKYDGIIRDKLINYKFNNQAYLYKFFLRILLSNCNFLNIYDIILPVPIHIKRKLKRGYNQSELIIKEFAKNINLEYSNDVLIKIIDTKAQSTLNKQQRISNVLGVYRIENEQKIDKKSILLIDDIYTTGSTVNECSKILKQNGAKSIHVLTIAKD